MERDWQRTARVVFAPLVKTLNNSKTNSSYTLSTDERNKIIERASLLNKISVLFIGNTPKGEDTLIMLAFKYNMVLRAGIVITPKNNCDIIEFKHLDYFVATEEDIEKYHVAKEKVTQKRSKQKTITIDTNSYTKTMPINTKSDASVLGRSIAGAIIAGPAGAVVGAATAVNRNSKNRHVQLSNTLSQTNYVPDYQEFINTEHMLSVSFSGSKKALKVSTRDSLPELLDIHISGIYCKESFKKGLAICDIISIHPAVTSEDELIPQKEKDSLIISINKEIEEAEGKIEKYSRFIAANKWKFYGEEAAAKKNAKKSVKKIEEEIDRLNKSLENVNSKIAY